MSPLTWLYRRFRAFRLVTYLLAVALTLLIWMVGDDQFAHYTQTGDLRVFTGFVLFAAFAWWYGEDRDRRQAARGGQRAHDDDEGGNPR